MQAISAHAEIRGNIIKKAGSDGGWTNQKFTAILRLSQLLH